VTAALRVDGLVKRYGHLTAVDRVSLAVEEGEIFGIIGPNGSGKTTTVECAQGLRRPDAGTVQVFGLDPQRDRAEVRRIVGSQLQESALPDRIRVWEALRLFGCTGPSADGGEVLMAQWGLAAKRDASFAGLWGGSSSGSSSRWHWSTTPGWCSSTR
jgi:ABC-2 type transport system ATP-binding protein